MGKVYLNYSSGKGEKPWVLTWNEDGTGTQRLTFETEGAAQDYARQRGIRLRTYRA